MTRKLTETRRGRSFPLSSPIASSEFEVRTMRGAEPAANAMPGPLHRALRAATRSDHVSVDAQIAALDLNFKPDYAILLRAHEAVLDNLEADWRDEDRSDFAALVRCLRSDLKALNLPTSSLRLIARAPLPAGQQMGAAYVLRGSRLGAGVLRQRIRPPFPISYLELPLALSWPVFLRQLESPTADTANGGSYDVIRGARLTFELFSKLLIQAANAPG